VVHNLDVPEAKRKSWPKWATVVVNRDGVIEDVIQHFDPPALGTNAVQQRHYPHAALFSVRAGEMFVTLMQFEKKVKEVVAAGQL
jgi:hypothetical protein